MIEVGVFRPGERLELIDGEIIKEPPQGSRHATAVSLIQSLIQEHVGEVSHIDSRRAFHMRTQMPLALGSESEPEPDIAVVRGVPRDYRDFHPTSAVWIIEVADTTLTFDRGNKASLYARARIDDFWSVGLSDNDVQVFRQPATHAESLHGWRFRSVQTYSGDQQLTPLVFPQLSIRVRDMLP